MQARNVPVTKLMVVAAAAAAIAMGAVTLASNPGNSSHGGSAALIADTQTQSVPPPSPTVPSAAPTMKASPWKGGDWSGN